MKKNIFSTVDLKDFKDRFKKSKVSNDKRLQELVEYVADKKEIPKELTFEEYKYIRKLLFMSKKLDKTASTNTNKIIEEKPKEEIKKESKEEKPKTTKIDNSNSSNRAKAKKSTKSTTNSKSTTKKDSDSSSK